MSGAVARPQSQATGSCLCGRADGAGLICLSVGCATDAPCTHRGRPSRVAVGVRSAFSFSCFRYPPRTGAFRTLYCIIPTRDRPNEIRSPTLLAEAFSHVRTLPAGARTDGRSSAVRRSGRADTALQITPHRKQYVQWIILLMIQIASRDARPSLVRLVGTVFGKAVPLMDGSPDNNHREPGAGT